MKTLTILYDKQKGKQLMIYVMTKPEADASIWVAASTARAEEIKILVEAVIDSPRQDEPDSRRQLAAR